MPADHRYRITRRTKDYVWVRWTAFGCNPPRGVSHRLLANEFEVRYRPVGDGTYIVRRKQ